jgi:hypothetical protein
VAQTLIANATIRIFVGIRDLLFLKF